MLPWRRNKFVLVEDDAKRKAKSLSPGLAYTSLLSSFLRSCPDLLPDWPLERLGRVFRSRRQKVELNKEDPTYTVWYLGNAVTLHAKGDGCTDDAVGKIWARCGPGGGTKMKLTLGPHGLRMQPCERSSSGGPGGRRPAHAYLLPRITYCAADARHPRVFTWVYRHQARHKAVVLRCHAVLLARAHKARALARLLRQTALAAFTDFKRLQRQSDARHVRQQHLRAGGAPAASLPRAPLRRLLNAKCAYRPPPAAERGRGAPRLSSIQEEDEDQDEDTLPENQEGGLGSWPPGETVGLPVARLAFLERPALGRHSYSGKNSGPGELRPGPRWHLSTANPHKEECPASVPGLATPWRTSGTSLLCLWRKRGCSYHPQLQTAQEQLFASGRCPSLCPGTHRTPHPPCLSAYKCVWVPARCPTARTKTWPPREVRGHLAGV
uniref:Family with sequence similarity 43 member B n=1 Tax=Bos taurus TaxID=9913 RepID=G3MXB0_BOVIN